MNARVIACSAALLLAGLGCGDKDEGEVELVAELSLSAEALDYGSVDFGANAGLPITIANTGNAPLTIFSLEVTSPWEISGEIPEVLEGGQSTGPTIGFIGETSGANTGTLTLSTDDPDRPEVEIPLTASVTGAPTVTVSLSPEEVYTDTVVEAVIDVTGNARDLVVNYAWTVDNVSQSSEYGATLDGDESFDKDQVVRVIATVRVNSVYLDPVSAEVTVLNSAPRAPVPRLIPNRPVPGEDDVVCEFDPDLDLDGDDLSFYISWTVNGEDYEGTLLTTTYNKDTMPADELIAKSELGCSVLADDGDAFSAPGEYSITVQSP
jgi:hypothetical protein